MNVYKLLSAVNCTCYMILPKVEAHRLVNRAIFEKLCSEKTVSLQPCMQATPTITRWDSEYIGLNFPSDSLFLSLAHTHTCRGRMICSNKCCQVCFELYLLFRVFICTNEQLSQLKRANCVVCVCVCVCVCVVCVVCVCVCRCVYVCVCVCVVCGVCVYVWCCGNMG